MKKNTLYTAMILLLSAPLMTGCLDTGSSSDDSASGVTGGTSQADAAYDGLTELAALTNSTEVSAFLEMQPFFSVMDLNIEFFTDEAMDAIPGPGTGTINSTCNDGKLEYTAEGSENAARVSITATNYCHNRFDWINNIDEQITVNGKYTFSYSIDSNGVATSNLFNEFEFGGKLLNGGVETKEVYLNFDTVDEQFESETSNVNLTYKTTDGTQLRFDDIVMVENSSAELDVSGDLYHSVYGKAEVRTVSLLTGWPQFISGEIKLTGAQIAEIVFNPTGYDLTLSGGAITSETW